jgi:hypothetical protein
MRRIARAPIEGVGAGGLSVTVAAGAGEAVTGSAKVSYQLSALGYQ